MSLNPIKVILAEDHKIVRQGLLALLKLESDIQVVGEVADGRSCVELCLKLFPDVVVMDFAMPLLNGLEASRQLLPSLPQTKVLILSAHSDDAYVDQIMAAGASGYLVKQSSAHVLAEGIRKVHNGKQFFSPMISRRLKGRHESARMRGVPSVKKESVLLSHREMEVFQLIAEGKANKQTAAELHISVKTVEKHRQSLMDKLDIHDTAGLTRYAISTGIIENSVQATVVKH